MGDNMTIIGGGKWWAMLFWPSEYLPLRAGKYSQQLPADAVASVMTNWRKC
jgi:hypothetical protein